MALFFDFLATGSISPAAFSRSVSLYTIAQVGAPEPVTSMVPTPYESTGAVCSEASAYSSRSLVTVIFVLVAPSASSWLRTRWASEARSPESMRTPPNSGPATSTAVFTASSML